MLTAKLVRLDTAWSATPQLMPLPALVRSRHGVAPLLPVGVRVALAHCVSDHDLQLPVLR